MKRLARNDLRKILNELEIKIDGETWTDLTAHHVEIPEGLKDDCDDELWEVFKRKTKKSYILVEWDQNDDETDHDMWRLLWGCYSYRGWATTDAALFIDRQSALDKTVIVATIL